MEIIKKKEQIFICFTISTVGHGHKCYTSPNLLTALTIVFSKISRNPFANLYETIAMIKCIPCTLTYKQQNLKMQATSRSPPSDSSKEQKTAGLQKLQYM